MEKLFHFLFVFLVLLLISFTRSETEVSLQLEIDFNCSASDDTCDSKNAFCNSAGKCQCLFAYSPSGTTCQQFKCESPGEQTCSQLYNSSATCHHGKCGCFGGFVLNARTQKCELSSLKTRRLGDHCITDHQCGDRAGCTTMGECRCHVGGLPETEFTCSNPHCSSTEFCHTNITANTVCNGNNCQCPYPYFGEDSDTFECVRVRPDTVPLGAPCANSTFCGDGAQCTTGNEQICKCKLGYGPTSNTSCEVMHCVKDEYCHKAVSPMTFCQDGPTRSCGCKEGYHENSHTLECSPEAPNIGEPCAQKNDTNYKYPCSFLNAICKDQKCVCPEGSEARKDLPFRCGPIEQPK